MRDILGEITRWRAEKRSFVLARVTQTWGSAPRRTGAAMIISDRQEVAGSVSGGCIEGAVVDAAGTVLERGKPVHLHFGVTNETAWSVGLTCGGKVSVWLSPYPALSGERDTQKIGEALEENLQGNRPCILLTRLDPESPQHLLVLPDGSTIGDWGNQTVAAVQIALSHYTRRQNGEAILDEQPIFVHSFPRKQRLLIIGAAHISIPLVTFGKQLGFEVIIVDPRQIFGNADRFQTAPDEMYNQWPDDILPTLAPDEDTFAVLLTHDPKIDDPALHLLLKTPVGYIGALGSKKNQAKRVTRLQEAGFDMNEIKRIHGPVGLDIGAKTPEEIALSIISQIVQVRESRKNR